MKKLLVFAAMLIVFSCQRQASDNLRPESEPQTKINSFAKKEYPKNKPNEIIVRLKPGASEKVLANRTYKKTRDFYQITVLDVDKALQEFKSNPDVEYVGLNYTHQTQLIPNDPTYTSGAQWNLPAIGAEAMWNSGNVGSKDVYVAVLDEGSGYWFCDLNSKIWTNEAEVNGVAGRDDDLNGYVDDVRGWNWFDNQAEMYNGNNDHGTWCESMIGAETNNNNGIASVMPNVKIISLKFLSDYGFDTEAAKAVDYAIWLKKNKGINIVAISNSWGGGPATPVLKEAIHRAALADINFVCAAGNSNQNTVFQPMYPAAYDEPNILSVGASDQSNLKAWFSNYSTDSNSVSAVDIFAPGVGIPAIIPISHQEGVRAYSGTSMATPHVAAAIGLIASVHPTWNYDQRQKAILAAAKRVPELAPYATGGRLLNLNDPVFFGETDPVIPDGTCGTPPFIDNEKPSTMVLTLDSTVEDPVSGLVDIYVSWPKVTDNVAVTSINFSLTPYWAWSLTGGFWTTFCFPDLPMDRVYNVVGQARDSWGNVSDPSNVITLDYTNAPPPTDQTPPTKPTNLKADGVGKLSFHLDWDASTDNVGVAGYRAHWRQVGRTDGWSMSDVANLATDYWANIFIEPATTYECMIMAFDAAGNFSAESDTIHVTTLSDNPPPPPPPPPPPVGDIIDPVVTILSPQDGYQIPVKGNRNVKIAFSATDNIGVTGRQILIDGVVVATNVSSYQWNANKASKGNHLITCKAFDAAGNEGSKSVTVIKN